MREKLDEAQKELEEGAVRHAALKKDCEDALPALEVLTKGESLTL